MSVNFAGTNSGNDLSDRPVISSDGEWVVFHSEVTNLSTLTDNNNEEDLFAFNRHTGDVTLITINYQGTAAASGFGGLVDPVLSGGVGTAVRLAFASTFTNLVSGDTNGQSEVFVRNLPSGQTFLVSGIGASGWASQPLINAGGDWIAFTSDTPDPVANDNKGRSDCFLNDGAGIILISRNAAGTGSGNEFSTGKAVNGDRGFVVFESRATNLDPIDNNGWIDTYRSEVPNWGDWGCGSLDVFSDGFETGSTSEWSAAVP